MKRFTTWVFLTSLVLCLSVLGFGQAPRTPQERQNTRVDRTERRTDRLEKKDDRVTNRDDAENKDRKVTNAREDVLAKRIEANEKLRTRVTPLLPAGENLTTAASGFKNEGQFIAALHVSKNTGIPFDDLKAKMTGSNPMSLGDAIHALKPTANATTEAAKAEDQAKNTMK
jgi:hypothetical protein